MEFSDTQRNFSGLIQVSQIVFNPNYNIGKFFVNFKNSLNLLEKKRFGVRPKESWNDDFFSPPSSNLFLFISKNLNF